SGGGGTWAPTCAGDAASRRASKAVANVSRVGDLRRSLTLTMSGSSTSARSPTLFDAALERIGQSRGTAVAIEQDDNPLACDFFASRVERHRGPVRSSDRELDLESVSVMRPNRGRLAVALPRALLNRPELRHPIDGLEIRCRLPRQQDDIDIGVEP